MKLLRDILYKAPMLDSIGSTNLAVSKICFDSREVTNESLFVALPGTLVDGHDYIDKALEKGARSIICETLPDELADGISYIQVKNARKTLGVVSANFFDNPSEELDLVAVTGTNGKTTTASLLHALFSLLDQKSGLLSTVNIKVGKEEHPATHTTPDPVSINRHLRMMVDAGCKYCFMEASSHGIEQDRIAGLKFKGAIFTNITHDHLDYHKTFDDYILAKKKLFDNLPASAFALVNGDDRHGETMLHHTKARKYFFALKSEADYKAKILEQQIGGMLLKIGPHEIWSKLIGAFNAYNLIAVYGAASLCQQDDIQIATALSNLQPVEGRFQHVSGPNGITAIIDYAHTPDALTNVINTIARIRDGQGKLITVVGCGGNRDKAKRPAMARIATENSDQVVFTSDNPRGEDPEVIIKEMEDGVEMQNGHKYLSIVNRKEAIKTAVKLAGNGDIILIAGKGHEKYQEIKGERFPFDDLELAQTYLTELKN